MALLPDHRVCSVSVALASPLIAVGVSIRDDAHLLTTAILPERNEPCAVEDDDTGVEGGWVQIVVANELRDPPRTLLAKQERTALALTVAAVPELADQAHPKPDRNPQCVSFHGRAD